MGQRGSGLQPLPFRALAAAAVAVSSLLPLGAEGLQLAASGDQLPAKAPPRRSRVACVGDSITSEGYTDLLQQSLGSGYDVMNFGHPGRTAQRNGATCKLTGPNAGPSSYWDAPEYQNALSSRPDVVVVMLGTNDFRSCNSNGTDPFKRDLEGLISSFKALDSRPRLVSVIPPPLRVSSATWWDHITVYFRDALFNDTIQALIEEVAAAVQVDAVANAFAAFQARGADMESLYKDGVHPNNDGSRLLAEVVAQTVQEVLPPR